MTGTTVITREPEWDDHSRAVALALHEYEISMCGCGCGQPVEVATDKTQAFKVEKYVCQARRATEKVRREESEAKKNGQPGWDDGLHYYAVPFDDEKERRA